MKFFLISVGDCAMSNWSPYGECQCDPDREHYRERYRTRRILRAARPRGQQCGATTDRERCPCYSYTKVYGQWSSCIIQDNKPCGKGRSFIQSILKHTVRFLLKTNSS